jgi:cysteinyl-tRNA synthetase
LRAAQNSLYHLYRQTAYFDWLNSRPRAEKSESRLLNQYRRQFLGFISDDLNTPKALALLWQLSADQKLSPAAKKSLLLEFDAVLGLGLRGVRNLIKTPPAVKRLVKEREKVRNNKQFVQADGLRKRIEALGYIIEDTPEGPFVWPKKI